MRVQAGGKVLIGDRLLRCHKKIVHFTGKICDGDNQSEMKGISIKDDCHRYHGNIRNRDSVHFALTVRCQEHVTAVFMID